LKAIQRGTLAADLELVVDQASRRYELLAAAREPVAVSDPESAAESVCGECFFFRNGAAAEQPLDRVDRPIGLCWAAVDCP
jgi:hypothetical protein